MKHSNDIMWILNISVFLIILNACATAARPQQMIAQSLSIPRISQDSPMYHAIVIAKAGGGEETNPLLSSKVGNKELEDALRESMRQYGFLSNSNVDAPYQLEVFLIDLKQPIAGFTMIVGSSIRYKLISNRDGKILYDDIITASDKATVDDTFHGVTRLKIATEKSIRANIAVFMERLHSLKATE